MLPKTCPVCHRKALSYNMEALACDSCKVYQRALRFYQRPLVWANRNQWWWRLPFLLWFAFMLVQSWRDPIRALSRYTNPLSAFNFAVHELGHIIFSIFNDFWHILGGSLFQIVFPILWLVIFWRKRYYFASALCWCWLGLNLFDVAVYAADARARLLPLAAGVAGLAEQGSDETYDRAHDWYQILSRTNHLNSDLAIAHNLRIAATIVFIIGLTIASLLFVQMIIGQMDRLRLRNANRKLTLKKPT